MNRPTAASCGQYPGRANADTITDVERSYLPKPSTSDEQASYADTDEAEKAKAQETMGFARACWVTQVYPGIFALTQGRRLRLHVNISGYADRKSTRLNSSH